MPYKLSTVLYTILLAVASLRPGSGGETPPMEQMLHNLAHIPAYAVLTYLLTRCVSRLNHRNQVLIALSAFAFGILMEIGQSFVPNRYFSPRDMMFNAAGILLVLLFLSWRKNP
jgi:VanZ family protein